MAYDEVKVHPRVVTTALFLILLLLANLGVLLFLVIRDINDELTGTIAQEAKLEAYRVLDTIEKIVLASERRGLDEAIVHNDELIEEVNAVLDRKRIYLYCAVMDREGQEIFRLESERVRISYLEETSDDILRSPVPVHREIVAHIDDEPVKILTVWVPIVIQDERAGTLMLGVSESLISEQMGKITSRVIREYLVVGAVIVIIVAGTFLTVVRLIGKVRQAEARIQYGERLIYAGTLASGLGHEIRNSLNAIQINAQMLGKVIRSVAPEKLDLLDSIRISVGELESLASEFLRFAKPSELKRDLLSINTPVREVLDFVEGECMRSGVKVVERVEDDMPWIRGDAQQLKQVFLNLILNANQAMPEGGTLTVSTRRLKKGWVAVDIADTGVGIPESDRPRIFDPFYSTKRGGTGLGLPIARRIVEEHGGQIGFQSKPDGGTTFTVELPTEDDRLG